MQLPRVGDGSSKTPGVTNVPTFAKADLSANKARYLASVNLDRNVFYTDKGKLAYREWKAINGKFPWSATFSKSRSVRLDSIANKSHQRPFKEGFNPFQINGRTYHALGPAMASEEREQKDFGLFISKLPTFDVVINLMENSNPLMLEAPWYYPNKPQFNALYDLCELNEPTGYLVYKHKEKLLYHFTTWKDGYEIVDDDVAKIVALAKLTVNAQNENKAILIHCKAGWGRTPLFIAICELIHKTAEIKKSDNDRVRFIIYDALKQLAKTTLGRRPNDYQCEQFFSNEFIDKIRELL